MDRERVKLAIRVANHNVKEWEYWSQGHDMRNTAYVILWISNYYK